MSTQLIRQYDQIDILNKTEPGSITNEAHSRINNLLCNALDDHAQKLQEQEQALGQLVLNPVNPDAEVVIKSIVSNNYVPGVDGAGWAIEWGGDFEAENALIRDTLKIGGTLMSHNYSFGDTGFKLQNGNLEIQNLTVNDSLNVRQLSVSEVKASNGSQVISDAMIIDRVEDYLSFWRCYIDTDENTIGVTFQVDDIIRCQVWNTQKAKYYLAVVTAVGPDYFDLVNPTIEGNGIPQPKDVCVRWTNLSNESRQGLIYLTSHEPDSPYIDIIKNNQVRGRFGYLGGILSEEWGQLPSDVGTYLKSGYFENVNVSGKIKVGPGSNVYNINETDSRVASKSKLHYGVQPTSYNTGDTWQLLTNLTLNGIDYKSGDILIAAASSTTFVSTHWVKSNRYIGQEELSVVEEQISDQQMYHEFSSDKLSWHEIFVEGDKYMRQKKGSGNWSLPIPVVGKDGEDGVGISIKGNVPNYDALLNISNPQPGDAYLAENTGKLHIWDGTAWSSGTEFKGTSSYTHIRYAQSSTGNTGFTSSPVGAIYLGIRSDDNPIASEIPSDYAWSLIRGVDGINGLPGLNGVSGKTFYLHMAYADSETGAGFSQSPNNKSFLGTYTDEIELDSSDPSMYTWVKFRGEPIASNTEPPNKYIGITWIDTSLSPAQLKTWDGTKWNIVNEIKIGATNLLTQRANNWESGYWSISNGTAVVSPDYIRLIDFQPLLPHSDYVLSGDERIILLQFDGSNNFLGYIDKLAANPFIKFTSHENAQKFKVFINDTPASPILPTFVETVKIKLERGNIPTSWSIHPEDIVEQLEEQLSQLSDLASDNKLTPTEKQIIKKEWDAIQSEKVRMDNQADIFMVSPEKSVYGTAYINLSTYLAPYLVNLNITSDIVGTTLRANFKAYYDALIDLNNAISNKANDTAKAAKVSADAANGRLDIIVDDNKFSPIEKQAIRKEWDIISYERNAYITQATAFNITVEKDNYNTAFQSLANYLNGGTVWVSPNTPVWINDANLNIITDITGSVFRAMFKNYYDTKTILLNKIAEIPKTLSDSAISRLNDLSSDSKLTPVEKYLIRKEWETILSEKPSYNAQAVEYGANSENGLYNTAFQSLANYLNGGTTWSSPSLPLWITDTNLSVTTDIIGADFRTFFRNYYDARTNLVLALTAKIKAIVDLKSSAFIGDTPPTATKPGEKWFDTNTLKWKEWNGTAWVVMPNSDTITAQYLRDALTQSSELIGGLNVVSLLALRDLNNIVRAYANSNANPNGTGIAFAAGVEHFGLSNETQKIELRHDGSGKLANGNILWDTYGNLQVRGKVTIVGTDSNVPTKTEAQAMANTAESNATAVANQKNKNHLSQPSTYQAGDTWTLTTDTVINGQSYKAGEILTSSTTSGSFISAHWTKLVRYTDDTKADALNVRVSDVEAELIDEFIFTPKASYSNAHLVLSLFKLIPTAQYAVRIQRTDGQTKDIGFTTSNKINEQEIVTFAEGQECRVNVWYNQVGNNNNPYQNIWANQPAIYSGTDFYKVNGATSIFFDINRGPLQYLMFTNVVNRSAFIAGKFTEDNTHTVWYLGHSSSYVYHTGGTLAIFSQQNAAPEIWNGLIKINGNVKAPTDIFPLNAPVIFSMVHTAQVGAVNRLSSDRIEDGVQGRTCWGNMFTFALFPTDETAQISNIEYDLTTTTTTTKFGLIKAKLAEQEERLNEWASDGSVSPTEKTGLAQTQVEVSKLKDDIVDRATAAGVAYYVFVNTYWIPFNNDLTALTQTTPESISVATAAPNFAANRLNFYNKLNELEKAIQEAIDYKATSAYDAIQAEPLKIRYIKWWQDKNIANPDTGCYFAELKAIIADGSNIAFGKSVTGSFTSTPSPLSSVTDGDISSYAGVNNQAYNWVKIDLGEVREDIKKIDIWGYSFGSYKHQRVSVEVSDDDITYKTVFDTNQTGTYVETPAGKTIQISTTKIEQIDAKAESKAKVYYQDDPPTGLVAENKGYLWIDINDNNKQYTWSGTAWVLTQDSATAQSTANSAAAAASSAQASANSKNTTFISPSSSTPTATKINDLWFDTTNKVWKSWNGVSWDLRQDGTLLSMTYLSEALAEGNFTSIAAGLTLGSLIAVKKGSPTPVVTAYMNGVASNPIAFAAGVENFSVAGSETQKVAIRTDGSGFLAAGKIYWDTAGNLFVNAVLTSTRGNIAGFEMGSDTINGQLRKWLKSSNGEASMLFENLQGQGFIRLNESQDSPLISLRTDSEDRAGMSISTYANNAVALQLLANVGSKYAIASAGGHQFYQRSGERWNAPGVLAVVRLTKSSGGAYYIQKQWAISPLQNSSWSRSGSSCTFTHNIGHTDYIAAIHPGKNNPSWYAENLSENANTLAFTIANDGSTVGDYFMIYLYGRNILQPDYYYNTQQTAYAYREGCNWDEEPSQHSGTVYAGDPDCTSNISQADANNKAYQKAYQIATQYAAINGYCTYRGDNPY